MAYRVAAITVLLLLMSEAMPARAAPTKKPDLILRAKVTRIFISNLPRSRLNWVIQTRVLRVLKGKYKGQGFDFRVHSPSRSNLRVGQVITIEAYRVRGGYRVPYKRY